MYKPTWCSFTVLAQICLGCANAVAQSAGITEIGALYVPFLTSPVAISANGTTLAGTTQDQNAFIWTAAGGLTPIGKPAGATTASVSSISGDGSVVVGGAGGTAFRWTRSSGFTDLGALNPARRSSAANGISADGTVIVGTSSSTLAAASGLPNLAIHPFIWTSASGMIDLAPDSRIDTTARAVSADGRVIVGNFLPSGLHPSAQATTAYRWSSATGFTSLTGLQPNIVPASDIPNATNADGSIVVGSSTLLGAVDHAVSWNASGAVTDLGALGGSTSAATSVNASGTIIVGTSTTTSGRQVAFRWTNLGMRDLNQLLSLARVNLGGITLTSATGISADGQFIAATGGIAGDNAAHGFLVVYAGDIGGLANPADLVASVDQIRQAQSRLMAQQHGIAAMLLGDLMPFANGSELGGFAAIGSATGGGGGRIGLGEGFSIRIAAAATQQHYQGVTQNTAALTALSARYVHPTPWDIGLPMRPVVELGGWFAPDLALRFSRSYANGAGIATGTSTTKASMSYVFGRLGGSLTISPDDELRLGGELGRQYFSTNAATEAFSAQNPFNAAIAGGNTALLLGKLQATWTHRFFDVIDTTLFVAGARSLWASGSTDATIAALGQVRSATQAGTSWAEYGARIGFRTARAVVDVFAGGIAGGGKSVGSSVHGGAGVRVAF